MAKGGKGLSNSLSKSNKSSKSNTLSKSNKSKSNSKSKGSKQSRPDGCRSTTNCPCPPRARTGQMMQAISKGEPMPPSVINHETIPPPTPLPSAFSTATDLGSPRPIIADIKGPLTVRTRRRTKRDTKSGDIVVEETIDILGSNDPSPLEEKVKAQMINSSVSNLKIKAQAGKPTVGGEAMIAAGIAQLNFTLQLPAEGPLDFTWDQQFTSVQTTSPIPVDFTQRPLNAQSISDLSKNDFNGPVNISLHLDSYRSTSTNGPSNTVIRNAVEVRFGDSKAAPTTELRKKVPSPMNIPGNPQIRERVFLGDAVIRLDRDMFIRPEDVLGEMCEDVRTYDLIPTAAFLAMNQRRFSMSPYSELFGFPADSNMQEHLGPTPPAIESSSTTPQAKTGSIKSNSDLSLSTAISYRSKSPTNRAAMCPTASSSSVQTTRSRDTSLDGGRSSRSRVPKPSTNPQKVSARTGISMNRLHERAQSAPSSASSSELDVKTATEISHLEDSSPTAILWMSDSVETAQSPGQISWCSSARLPLKTDATQTFLTPTVTPHGQHHSSASSLGRYTTATDSSTRTAKSISTPSTTKTAHSISSSTPRSRDLSACTPIRSQSVSTAHHYSPYPMNRRSPYAREATQTTTPETAWPTHFCPSRQHANGQPLGSISQAPLVQPNATGRSSARPSDGETIGRGIGQSLTSTNNTGAPESSETRHWKKTNIAEPLNETLSDSNAASTYESTYSDGVSAKEPSVTGTEATAFSDDEPAQESRQAKPCFRRKPFKQCRGCGKPLRSPAEKKNASSSTQNPSVQVFDTKEGLRFRVTVRLDVRDVMKQKQTDSPSSKKGGDRIEATAVVWLPPGIEPTEKATLRPFPNTHK